MGSHLGAVRIHGKHPLTPSTCFVGLNNTYLFIYCLPVSPNRYNLQDHEDPACFVLCCICSTHNSVCGISIYFCWMNEWMTKVNRKWEILGTEQPRNIKGRRYVSQFWPKMIQGKGCWRFPGRVFTLIRKHGRPVSLLQDMSEDAGSPPWLLLCNHLVSWQNGQLRQRLPSWQPMLNLWSLYPWTSCYVSQ